MRNILITLFLLLSVTMAQAETVEIDIHGMTCAFCVEGLQKQLSKLPDVAKVEVSLKFKKVRIESKGERLDMEKVREAIIDAGFAPVEVHQIASDQS